MKKMLTNEQLKDAPNWQVDMELVLIERTIDRLGKDAIKFKIRAEMEALRAYRGRVRAELAERHPFGGFN